MGGIWNDLYEPGKFREHWAMWRGKPLLLTNPDALPDEMREFFTVRRSWAWSRNLQTGQPTEWFGDGQHAWTWVDHVPQGFGWDEDPAVPEQTSVSPAQHPTTNIGKSFSACKHRNSHWEFLRVSVVRALLRKTSMLTATSDW